jgi:hypothetical protein
LPESRWNPNFGKLQKDSLAEVLPGLNQVHRHAIVTLERSLYLGSNLLEQEGADVVMSYVCITSQPLHKRLC